MLRINQLKLEIGEKETLLKKKAAKKLRIKEEEIKELTIYKKSLDARKKDRILFQYVVDVKVKDEQKILERNRDKDVSLAQDMSYHFPEGEVSLKMRPVVIGFGPCGMFAALLLAQMGLKPLVLERGECLEKRTDSVNRFWEKGILNKKSNVQFGEGGAGTFSDGKLTSRIKDPRCRKVLEEFVRLGAPKEILYDAKPHIGTDKLKGVVKNIREEILSLGGEIRFDSQVTDFIIENGTIAGLVVNEKEKIAARDVVLAIGHSARDTFETLYDRNFSMEQKPFAVGVRIEHRQEDINAAQYGDKKLAEILGAADYRLTCQTKGGRAVYTFCMCPGGYVVAAASEESMVAVNGMSEYKRDGENANSALLVQVFPSDFEGDHPLAGMYFQRELEKKAFLFGKEKYDGPVQRVGDFLGRKETAKRTVTPSYRPGVSFTELENIFPPFITEALKEAIVLMGKKLKGFDASDALLTAVESRSSSPVRILREKESYESLLVKGVYPAGEGAGYAGGIISAAVDGIVCAEKIWEKNRMK